MPGTIHGAEFTTGPVPDVGSGSARFSPAASTGTAPKDPDPTSRRRSAELSVDIAGSDSVRVRWVLACHRDAVVARASRGTGLPIRQMSSDGSGPAWFAELIVTEAVRIIRRSKVAGYGAVW